MHKKALECAKKTLEEFCALGDPTCEQAELFKMVMCGLSEFVNTEYKATIIDEMKEAKEEEELMSKMGMSERMGYNRRRYANGRYAPKGVGRMGYYPDMEMEDDYMAEYLDNPMAFIANMRAGYNNGGNNIGGQNGRSGNLDNGGHMMGYGNGRMHNPSRHGENYDMYREHRRHYTETENPDDKMKMDKKAEESYHDSLDVFRELWRDGDQQLKTKMRNDIQTFINNELK